MRTSEQINELAGALAKAQAQFTTVTKDKSANAGKYGYTYASLPAVMEAITGPLGKHGLAVVQSVEQGNGQVTVTTRLFHSSGQWLEGDCVMPIGQGGPQAVGSAITYGRRYGLSTLLGIVTDDDDDGAHAQANSSKTSGARTRSPKPRKPREATAKEVEDQVQTAKKADKDTKELQDIMAFIKGADTKEELDTVVDGAADLVGEELAVARAAYSAKRDELTGRPPSPPVDDELDEQYAAALARDG
jgi:hypothetical protein